MTESILPGKTAWETREYLRDHGHRIAAAQAYAYLGHLIETDGSYPLPEGSDGVIARAAAAMQDVHAARVASVEAYAAERRAAIQAASDQVYAATQPERGAA